MSVFTSFKAQWLGRYIDYDGVDGYECTDEGKQWLTTLTGKRYGTLGNAITWWKATVAALLSDCTKVPGSSALEGDLVIKRPNHVGIATGNINATQLEILEQNGHTGTGKKAPGNEIRTRWINRSDVAGLLRPNVLHATSAAATPTSSGLVGKTVHLSASVSSWRVYLPGTHTVKATLNPKKFGGLSYVIKAVDSLPARVLIDTKDFGRVSLPIDSDATIN